MKRKCLWCLESEPKVTFVNKAHTIPMSLGGQNYNQNTCDSCNKYFGDRSSTSNNYSIEEALKETFNVSRRRFLYSYDPKKKVGRFKSKFFDIKERNRKLRFDIKPSFKFNRSYQVELCRAFKRGLYKMFFEELNRQKNIGFESKYDIVRKFSRYNIGELPVFYFLRKFPGIIMMGKEAETPVLFFDRMNYLFSNDKFVEIEFLGHVFGFPISNFNAKDFKHYAHASSLIKQKFFTNVIEIKTLLDIDLTLSILN